MPWRARRAGLELLGEVSIAGMPIVGRFPGSRILVGSGTTLCSNSRATALGVNHPVVLRTLRPGAEITIGQRVRISGATICAANRVEIGDDVCIGANATIVDTDFHSLDPELRKTDGDSNTAHSAPVRIRADAFIGGGSYVLKGVTVGRAAAVGAGAVVTREVPDRAVVAGNPARRIGSVANERDPQA